MSFRQTTTAASIALATLLAGGSLAQAAPFEVTITNLTAGQPISPPLIVSHRSSIALAEAGEEASAPLATVAEDGDASDLASLLETLDEVRDVVVAEGPIPPGGRLSVTLDIGRGDVLSGVGMLVNSNDAFFFLDSLRVSRFRTESVAVAAWDSGSEANTEDCDDIPGPACPPESSNERQTEEAEGFVHVHRGIQGGSDLIPAAYDWRNPTVLITVERVRGRKDDD
ncbi:MAG: spondin domain-containing protein [Kiloniellales bacterium]|nr:spondin domain-containing protein [Kiloniellales bacterium]